MNRNKAPSLIGYSLSILINQFIAIVISVFVTTVIGFFSSGGFFEILRFLICFLIYFSLIYTNSWRAGSSDTNRIKLGMMPDNKLRGVNAGLVASIPGIVFAVLAFLSESGHFFFFELLEQDGAVLINRFMNFPIGALYALTGGKPALNFLFPLFVPIISGIAYICGRNGISLKQIILYKADEE